MQRRKCAETDQFLRWGTVNVPVTRPPLLVVPGTAAPPPVIVERPELRSMTIRPPFSRLAPWVSRTLPSSVIKLLSRS